MLRSGETLYTPLYSSSFSGVRVVPVTYRLPFDILTVIRGSVKYTLPSDFTTTSLGEFSRLPR